LGADKENFARMMAAATKSFLSLLFLLPRRPVFHDHQVFVATPRKNYSLNDWHDFLTDVGSRNLTNLLAGVDRQVEVAKAPNVEVF